MLEATPPALSFINAPVRESSAWEVLAERLENLAPGLKKSFQMLTRTGAEFGTNGTLDGEPHLISGSRQGALIRLEIKSLPLKPEQKAKAQDDRQALAEIADLAPMLMWHCDETGAITWAKKGYRHLAQKLNPQSSDASDILALFDFHPDQTRPRRHRLKLPELDHPTWYEVVSFRLENASSLHFASHAGSVVRAEEALRNFVQTLTKTFAHLSIGLAVFDRDRQLALFNPALSDLTTLEPEWLTMRPSLSAFLDRLREYRHVPEPKDYKTWRDQIAALEKAAEDETYEENWPLPGGQTYRVSGRPHPEGAVAFLFEDITPTIALKRQFRSELDLSQSVLDALPEAIAVFSATGDLVLSNEIFAKTWGVDPREMPAKMTINEAASLWLSACKPNTVWPELRFLSDPSRPNVKRQGRLCLTSGKTLTARFEPLAGGAVLGGFLPEPSPVQAEIELA